MRKGKELRIRFSPFRVFCMLFCMILHGLSGSAASNSDIIGLDQASGVIVLHLLTPFSQAPPESEDRKLLNSNIGAAS